MFEVGSRAAPGLTDGGERSQKAGCQVQADPNNCCNNKLRVPRERETIKARAPSLPWWRNQRWLHEGGKEVFFYNQWHSDSFTHPYCTCTLLGVLIWYLSHHHPPSPQLSCHVFLKIRELSRISPQGRWSFICSLFPAPALCILFPYCLPPLCG